MTHFLEESPGVWSMSRLAIGVLLGLAVAFVAAIIKYTFTAPSPDAGVIAALVGGLVAVVLNGAVAIINRNGGAETETE